MKLIVVIPPIARPNPVRAFALLAVLLATPARAGGEAQALYDRGEYAEAAKLLAAQVQEHPDDVDARVLLGRAQMGLRKFADAVDTLEDAVKRAPESAEAQYAYGQALGNRVNEVNMFRQPMMAGDIRKAFQRAVELEPRSVKYHEAMFEFYRQAPALVGGGMDKARAEAETLAKLDAAAGHRAEGALDAAEGRMPQAETEYRAAIAAAPKDADAYIELGLLYQKDKRYDDAFKLFDALLKKDPGNPRAEYQIGKTAALSGKRLGDGEHALKRYLATPPPPDEPSWAHAHLRLGGVYERMQHIADARAEYQAALALDSSLVDARKALAALPK